MVFKLVFLTSNAQLQTPYFLDIISILYHRIFPGSPLFLSESTGTSLVTLPGNYVGPGAPNQLGGDRCPVLLEIDSKFRPICFEFFIACFIPLTSNASGHLTG
jgi:hypothetical protein